jgi:tetratricopeptide (TPR) repeat protein
MGDRLRVTVQLVDTGSGYHRWSQRFDRDVGDIFAIQDEIAENVATSLRGDLSRREKEALHRPETAAAAYEFYLRGRQHLHRLRHTDLKESLRLFERAVGLDPGYAPAWSGIAAARAVLYQWWGARAADLAEADRASRRALELAPDLAEAHAARGLALSLARRFAEAEREFDRAIAVNPNLFDSYYDFARMCFARGQVERSAALFRKASEVRQEDYQSALLLGQSLRMLGREREAREAESEGLARARRALALNPLDGRALSLASHALFDDGRVEEALEWSRRALDLYPDEISPLINGAGLRARLGMKEEALDLLERVFARGWGKCDWVARDPDYDSLRDEPRFQRLIVGLK